MWWVFGFSIAVIWLMSIVFGLRRAIALDYVDRGDRVMFITYLLPIVLLPVFLAPIFCLWYQIEWVLKFRGDSGTGNRLRLFFNPAKAHDLRIERKCDELRDQRRDLRLQIVHGDFDDDPAIKSAMIELTESLEKDRRKLEESTYGARRFRRGLR